MALDNLSLKTISDDLERELVGAFFDKPFAVGNNQFALPYHSGNNEINKGRGTLILDLDGSNPFLTYSYDRFLKIQVNTPFFNSLKKLVGYKVSEVSKFSGERIIRIKMDSHHDLDDVNDSFDLIVELFPQRANAYIVAYPYGKVVSLFKESNDVFSERYISRNLPYLPPKPRREVDKSFLDLEEIKPYFSRSTFRNFEKYVNEVGFKKALEETTDSKSLYLIKNKVEPYHFGYEDAVKIEVKDIYHFFNENQKEIAKKLNESELINELKRLLKVTTKKKENLINDLEAAKKHLVYKEYGQVLFLHQLDCEPKQTYLDAEGYHIVLDPKYDCITNANKYFKRYHKAKLAIVALEPLIKKATSEIEYFSSKLLELDKAAPRDIQEMKYELVLNGYIKNKNIRISKKKTEAKYEPHYLVSDKYKIGFGMNALQNEELTFNIAHKDDMFIHVDKAPGSHVVILGGDSNETRLLASELALYLSNMDSGDLMIARRNKVKKNKDARGLVNVLDYKLITLKSIRNESIELFKKALKQ